MLDNYHIMFSCSEYKCGISDLVELNVHFSLMHKSHKALVHIINA